ARGMRLDIRIGGQPSRPQPCSRPALRHNSSPRGPAASVPLHVAPQGSDSGQCSQAQPCQSIDRAYHLAQPGQSVQLAGGDNPEQVVLYDAAREGARLNVVVRPTPGAQVRLQQLTSGPDRTTRGATHLEVQGGTILQDVAIHGCGAPVEGSECVTDSGGNYIVLRQLNILGP